MKGKEISFHTPKRCPLKIVERSDRGRFRREWKGEYIGEEGEAGRLEGRKWKEYERKGEG